MGAGQADGAAAPEVMADRVSAYAWDTTPLGAAQTWPASLRAAVAQCLASGRPCLLWWGAKLLQIANDAACALLDAQHAALAVPAATAWHEAWVQLAPLLERVMRTSEPAVARELPLVSPETAQPWSLSLVPLHDEAGRAVGVLGTLLEATTLAYERRQQLRLMADAVPQILWIANAEGATLYVNQRWTEYAGSPIDPASSLADVARFIHPDDVGPSAAVFDQARREGRFYETEMRLRSAAGQWRWFLVRAAPYRDPDSGQLLRWFGVSVDIHDRHLAEQALRESEARFRAIADLVPDLLWSNDASGRVEWFNRRWSEYTGQEMNEALGQGWLEAIHPDDRPVTLKCWRQTLQAQACFVAEHRIRRHDGAWRWHLLRSEPSLDTAGHVSRWFGSAIDVHDQYCAQQLLEQRVQQRTAELRAILDTAASAIVATDRTGHITMLNPAAERMLALPTAQAQGRSMLEFLLAEELRFDAHWLPVELVELLTPGAADKSGDRRARHRGEFTCVRTDGTRFPALSSFGLLRDTQGEATGFIVSFTDLSGRKAMEEMLRQRTREAEAASQAKSAFLAHMSHEFRTPLNAVIGLSELLLQRELPRDVSRFIGHIHQAGEQLLALTNDVLDLSRIESGVMQLEEAVFEPLALLDAVCTLVRPQADAKGLSLQLEAAPDLPARLVGDALRLKQVLLNLLSNAVKFTHAGFVALRAAPLTHGGTHATLRFEVQDTGIGIAVEAQVHVFEPFIQADGSTTRRFGGSGLGLSIVRSLVDMMDGQLALESQPGKGSTFSVTLSFPIA